MSLRRSVRTAKCPYGEMSYGEVSYGEKSYGEKSGHGTFFLWRHELNKNFAFWRSKHWKIGARSFPRRTFPAGLFPPIFLRFIFPQPVFSPLGLFPAIFSNKETLRNKNNQHIRVISLHQNWPAHAIKLTTFRVSYQHMLVSLPACDGRLTRNLVNLLPYLGKLWMCKFTCLCGSVSMRVTGFFSWVKQLNRIKLSQNKLKPNLNIYNLTQPNLT